MNRLAAVTIDRIGSADQRVYTGSATMSRQLVPDDAWINCCRWPAGLALTIPGHWKSGLYRARFESPDGPSTRAGDLYCLSVQEIGMPAVFAKCVTSTSLLASGLPLNGSTLLVNLQTRQNLQWKPAIEYRYIAATR